MSVSTPILTVSLLMLDWAKLCDEIPMISVAVTTPTDHPFALGTQRPGECFSTSMVLVPSRTESVRICGLSKSERASEVTGVTLILLHALCDCFKKDSPSEKHWHP